MTRYTIIIHISINKISMNIYDLDMYSTVPAKETKIGFRIMLQCFRKQFDRYLIHLGHITSCWSQIHLNMSSEKWRLFFFGPPYFTCVDTVAWRCTKPFSNCQYSKLLLRPLVQSYLMSGRQDTYYYWSPEFFCASKKMTKFSNNGCWDCIVSDDMRKNSHDKNLLNEIMACYNPANGYIYRAIQWCSILSVRMMWWVLAIGCLMHDGLRWNKTFCKLWTELS